MSRIGKMPVPIPQGVKVSIAKGNEVTIEGPRGKLSRGLCAEMTIAVESDQVIVSRPTDQRRHRSLHGLTRALLANMVEGVSDGYRRELQIVGVGYRALQREQAIVMSLGFSHPVEIIPPEGISLTVTSRDGRTVLVEGIDKELVGKVAAEIRALRKPEPYKGKGVRHANEYVRRKAGKAGKVL